jgi:UDP-hydrolysing UDP-N-acetyl-D-glucosamine 2-epimerase
MKAVRNHGELQLQTVIGASAILDRYGNIENLVRDDGFEVSCKLHMIVEGENPTTMAKSTGLGIIDLSAIFNNLVPDVVVVVGDRFDVVAPVITASFMNIPVAHIMGGEVSGTIDESIRHAITKMSHIHFPANEDARQRIIKMGEDSKFVFNVGCPRIDLVEECLKDCRNGNGVDQEIFFDKHKGVGGRFDLEKEKFLLVSQHAVTTEFGTNRKHIEETLLALRNLQMPTIMLWPNADAGSDEISKGIRTFRETYQPDWLHLFINLPVETYIKLMDICTCIVGNSSSAIREGALIGVPSVNIGTRQNGRLVGNNVLNADYDREEIEEKIRKQVRIGKYPSSTIYGDGTAGQRIAEILRDLDNVSVQKRIAY